MDIYLDTVQLLAVIATIFGTLILVPLIASFWNRPRFLYGFLPSDNRELTELFNSERQVRPSLTGFKRKRDLGYKCSEGHAVLAFLVSNVGRGDASDVNVMFEYNGSDFQIVDFHTEYLKVDFAYGSLDHFKSERFTPKVVDQEIIKFYESAGMRLTSLQLTGTMPANTFEIVLFDIWIDKSIVLTIKSRIRTSHRYFNQRSAEQVIDLQVV